MRISIVADIHEAIDELRQALAEFRRLEVDVVLSLGDACNTFGPAGRASEVITLLREAGAVGVWGNHDVGLSVDVSEEVRRQLSPENLEYMARMQPYLTIESCRFSHIEPWLDARKLEDLWYFDGSPDTPERSARSFAAVPEQYLFIGHFHQWLIMTPSGPIDWNVTAPIVLDRTARYLVLVAPVVNGWCAVFDTDTTSLIPIRCSV